MGIESASFIASLVATNPTASDNKSEGDDHLRLLKTAVQGSFPTSSKAWYNPTSQTKTADFSVLAADMNCTFLVDTSSAAVTATLPTLVSGDKGWECSFVKTNTGTSALFIAPASGTLQSGDIAALAKSRRCVPGVPSKAIWTGTAWILTRAINVPVGTMLSFEGSSLPVGYEWPNGQTLAGSSGSIYPDYFARKASLVVSDARGRVDVGKDDLGGSAASRVTTAGSNIDGATLGAVGGAETDTLTASKIPAHTHASPTDSGHTHHVVSAGGNSFAPLDANNYLAAQINAVVGDYSYILGALVAGTVPDVAKSSTSTSGLAANTGSAGSGAAHNNMQPSIIMNKILVVE